MKPSDKSESTYLVKYPKEQVQLRDKAVGLVETSKRSREKHSRTVQEQIEQLRAV